jgi:rhizosphere induced protein
MATQYSLIFVNNSTQTGSACVYQQDPDTTDPNVMSLAWFAKAAAPTTTLQFDWTVDYSFVWSETGTLKPGVMFTASQNLPADLSTSNQVQFTTAGGAYTFQNQSQGGQAGTLYVLEDNTIPPNQASVGIGMSGSGTFAVQAQPNITAEFTPHPEYWITFGNYTAGEVLDVTTITASANIAFPANTYSMTATLGSNNTWTVQSTADVNAAFVEARKKNPKALWGRAA